MLHSDERAIHVDPAKSASNLRKHGVSFEEALSAFGDPLARIHDDPLHSEAERRELIVGHSTKGRLCWSPSPSALGSSVSSALEVQLDMSVKTIKKRPSPRNRRAQDDLASEYRFDYAKSRPNRFARKIAKNAVVVVLDPDVAAVFRDPKRVNSLLRATIAALKKPGSRRAG
jgi:hypothetical protein